MIPAVAEQSDSRSMSSPAPRESGIARREIAEELRPVCPCGSSDWSDWGACRTPSGGTGGGCDDVVGRVAGRIHHCRHCALAFRSPALPPAAADALYAGMSGEEWQYSADDHTAWWLALDRMCRRAPGRVLDIGSFDGRFLAQVPPTWSKAAIEPNARSVALMRRRGIDAIQGRLTAEVCEPLRGKFDIVTLFDVLEHLHDPQSGIELAALCVRPGGVLWLSTGNFDHWTWRLLGPEHPYLAPVQHVSVGSATWFRRCCERQGWRPPRLVRMSHRAAARRDRVREAALAAYFGARRRRWPYRALVHVLHALPGSRAWRHRTYMPHIAALADHLFVEIAL